MEAAPSAVQNSRRLVESFGYWPSFHDAEVHRVELDRGDARRDPSVTLVIHVFDSDGTVDERGYYRRQVSVLATLRFEAVDDLELFGLGPQNVIFGLEITERAAGRHSVELTPSYGLCGGFTCRTADVIEVRPWPDGDGLPSPP